MERQRMLQLSSDRILRPSTSKCNHRTLRDIEILLRTTYYYVESLHGDSFRSKRSMLRILWKLIRLLRFSLHFDPIFMGIKYSFINDRINSPISPGNNTRYIDAIQRDYQKDLSINRSFQCGKRLRRRDTITTPTIPVTGLSQSS